LILLSCAYISDDSNVTIPIFQATANTASFKYVPAMQFLNERHGNQEDL
jgi:hypothetical protein